MTKEVIEGIHPGMWARVQKLDDLRSELQELTDQARGLLEDDRVFQTVQATVESKNEMAVRFREVGPFFTCLSVLRASRQYVFILF